MAGTSLSMKDIENSSIRDVFGRALVSIGERVPEVVLLGADAIGSTRGALFAKQFPERTFNFGIAEQEMVAAAAGFATCGKIPIATAYAFLLSMRACEQVRTDICYPNLSVKLMATHAGISMATGGTTHHATEDLAIMRSFANLTIIVPADALETVKAVEMAVEHSGPVYLRMGRGEIPNVHSSDYEFVIGRSICMRAGGDVSVIACGTMVAEAIAAADSLEKEGIDARVINMHTIKPLDEEAVIAAALETGAIVTAEEHNIVGGLGEAVAGVASEHAPAPVIRVGVRDCYCGIGPEDGLRRKLGLTSESIVSAVKRAISLKSSRKR